MTVDPRIGFWLCIALAAVGFLAGAGTQLTTIFGEHTAGIIMAVALLITGVGNSISAVLHAIPAGANSDAKFALGPPKPVIILALVGLGLLLFMQPAMAQTKPVARPLAQAPLSDTTILQKLHDDAVAASADAKANNDVIAQGCYDAIAATADAKLTAATTPGGGALLVFQKVRDFTRLNSSPVGTSLIVGCAPLVQDAKLNFVQFFANIGGAVLLKGLIPIP